MKYLVICLIIFMTACRQADPPNWFEVLPDDPARVLYESDYDTMMLYNLDSTPPVFAHSITTRIPEYLYRKSGHPDTIIQRGPGWTYYEKVFDSVGRMKYILWEDCTEPTIKINRCQSKPTIKSIEGYKPKGGSIKGYDTIYIENINDSLSKFYEYSIRKYNPNQPNLNERIYYNQKDSNGVKLQSWFISISHSVNSYKHTRTIRLHDNSGFSVSIRDNGEYTINYKITNGLITHCTENRTNDTSEYMYKYK